MELDFDARIVSGPGWKTAYSLNPQAINCLSGIHDLSTYYYARRVGEALIRLNSRHNISGRTARARWTRLKLTKTDRWGPSRTNRLARILNGARLLKAEIKEGLTAEWVLDDLRNEIAERIPYGSRVAVFTDGSSEPGRQCSGAGVCITVDEVLVWSGGFRVQSEGNNYAAEYAAASLAISLVPPKVPLDLYEDNKGVISSQNVVNPKERRRLRSAARAWRNTFAHEQLLRQAPTTISYVRSHTGAPDFISRGNEFADKVAKWALKQEISPLEAPREENFLLLLQGKMVKNDYLTALKKSCAEIALEQWGSLRTQGQWVRKDCDAVLTQSKRALEMANQYHKGDVWLFYVFLICNWLPTNYRRAKGTPGRDATCTLCTGTSVENARHLFSCPALHSASEQLRDGISRSQVLGGGHDSLSSKILETQRTCQLTTINNR